MDSVTSKIEQQILKLDRGSIFFPDDFVDLGTPEAIRQSLTRLCKEDKIINDLNSNRRMNRLLQRGFNNKNSTRYILLSRN